MREVGSTAQCRNKNKATGLTSSIQHETPPLDYHRRPPPPTHTASRVFDPPDCKQLTPDNRGPATTKKMTRNLKEMKSNRYCCFSSSWVIIQVELKAIAQCVYILEISLLLLALIAVSSDWRESTEFQFQSMCGSSSSLSNIHGDWYQVKTIELLSKTFFLGGEFKHAILNLISKTEQVFIFFTFLISIGELKW